MKLLSWNVNGVRSAIDKGFRKMVESENVDILCLQETKARPEQVDLEWMGDFCAHHWNSAEKKGYSGTAIFSKEEPLNVKLGMGIDEHDTEGRVISVEFPDFWVVTVYTPNSQRGLARLPYRLEWDDAFRKYLKYLEKSKPVLACGDFNVAHTEIDLANPKSNRKNAGFSDEERASFTALLDEGFVDTFREFEPDPHHYSWWTMRTNARERNIGWRLDYWLASASLRDRLEGASIRNDIFGSDHCPVELVIS